MVSRPFSASGRRPSPRCSSSRLRRRPRPSRPGLGPPGLLIGEGVSDRRPPPRWLLRPDETLLLPRLARLSLVRLGERESDRDRREYLDELDEKDEDLECRRRSGDRLRDEEYLRRFAGGEARSEDRDRGRPRRDVGGGVLDLERRSRPAGPRRRGGGLGERAGVDRRLARLELRERDREAAFKSADRDRVLDLRHLLLPSWNLSSLRPRLDARPPRGM